MRYRPTTTRPTARLLPALFGGALLLAACSADDASVDAVDFDGATTATDEDAADPDPDGSDRDDAGEATTDPGAAEEDAGDPTGDAADDDAEDTATEDAAAGDAPATGDLVDLTAAVPGTWPVGDAGTVTFSIVDGALVLDDVTAADGWRADVDEESADEIEVDFRRGNVEWEIEIELENDATILEIEIDQDIDDAAPGSFDIGDAGTFAFDLEDGRLVLRDLSLTDGWTLVDLDEEADEIEFEVVNGPRGFDVEVELDDGRIEVEIDFEVTGPVNG